MIDAIVGAVIIVAATTGLVMAVEVGNRIITQAGRHPLSPSERIMLRSAGLDSNQNLNKIEDDLNSFF